LRSEKSSGSNTQNYAAGASPAVAPPGGDGGYTFQDCLILEPAPPGAESVSHCDGCQATTKAILGAGAGDNADNPTIGAGPAPSALASDVGLVTGAFFEDHQAVTYQSQGQARGIDLQYSSAQADPNPVVQHQFTTPEAGDSSSISSITAEVSFGGVESSPTSYDLPTGGLADGATYNIPLQVDATPLMGAGANPVGLRLTENFGTGPGMTSITTSNEGFVNFDNAASDAMGAGWSVGGLQHVSQPNPGGPAVIRAGQQGTERFDPVYSNGQTDLQDLALASGTAAAQILANDGTGGFATGTAPRTPTSSAPPPAASTATAGPTWPWSTRRPWPSSSTNPTKWPRRGEKPGRGQ
jgi:hypothetical protein